MSVETKVAARPIAAHAERGAGKALWHTRTVEQALAEAGSRREGLDESSAAARLAENGPNELVETGATPWWKLLWQQLSAVMVVILLAAALLSLLLGKYIEAGAILAIVLLFAVLGFVQEYRAERAIAALRRMAVPSVRVLRGGTLREVPSRELVPGDVVQLEAGSVVPADGRVLESANLRVQEAALTGESEPIEKQTEALVESELTLGDRRNLLYMGTQVTYGRGALLVTATGMATELGRIAALIQTVEQEETPLQRRLDGVGKMLAIVGALVALLVLAIGLLGGEAWSDMLLTAISVAVAVIPEGLPAVVTFTLAIGAQRMLKRNALIRKLPAVETLGSVTVIASDKTGTLTQNRMTVTVVDVAGHRLQLTEELRHAAPSLTAADRHPEELGDLAANVQLLLRAGVLCNDARLQQDADGAAHAVGDPTEGALLIAAERMGIDDSTLLVSLPRVGELPFDSERKRMTTVHRVDAEAMPLPGALSAPYLAVSKGAVDGLLDVSTHVLSNGSPEPMTAEWRVRIEAANAEMAGEGKRVLGFALRALHENPAAVREEGLTFIGLAGMIDPPRPEVRDAVARAVSAGIRPIMITGDHPLTASVIARELGISRTDRVLTGADLNRMSELELDAVVEQVSVYARVSPEHKLRIVDALQRRGHVAAMTGDGVNDAPALRAANIGVAMGITGTDVSKEAAGMVLRDDNFATIVAAVEEGRVIYDNLRRFVKFAVAGNLGKILVMLLWPLPFLLSGRPLTDPVALLPLQLLWLNLLTDGLLGLSLGAEPAERNVMARPPHKPTDGIFANGLGTQVVWTGILVGVIALGVGTWYHLGGRSEWQTMIFATLASLQIFQAVATRSSTESVFAIGLFSNRWMLWIVPAVTLLMGMALWLPGLADSFLGVVPLAATDVGVVVAAGALLFVIVEVEKWVRRRWSARTQPLVEQSSAELRTPA